MTQANGLPMTDAQALLRKLNYRPEHAPLVVIDAAQAFEGILRALPGLPVQRAPVVGMSFGIGFATTRAQRDRISQALTDAAAGDAVLWLAYPKRTARQHACEFDRDSGWDVFAAAGFEAVRQVAIDADWTALRFRRVAFIRSLRRAPERIGSAAGRARLAQQGEPRPPATEEPPG